MEAQNGPQRRRVISVADKQRLIDAHAAGLDYAVVAQALNIPRGTAWAIIRRHQEHGYVARRRGGIRNQKVDQEMIQHLVHTVEEHCEYTLDQLNNSLRVSLPNKPHISPSTVSKCLHGQLIRLKKIQTIEADWNHEDVLHGRRAFAEWMLTLDDDIEVVFIDESGFNLWLARTRGRARRGDRAVRIVAARRGPNFSCKLAVSATPGVILADFHAGGHHSGSF